MAGIARIGVNLYATLDDTNKSEIEIHKQSDGVHVLNVGGGNPYGICMYLNDHNLNRLADAILEHRDTEFPPVKVEIEVEPVEESGLRYTYAPGWTTACRAMFMAMWA